MSTNEIRMTSIFPRAPSLCREVSEPFFECINQNSQKLTTEDKDASKRGLIACQKQLEEYEKCVKKFEETKPLSKLRVQEEYRFKQK